MKAEDLPNDIESLKSLVLTTQKELQKKDEEILLLHDLLKDLRRQKFAPSSESSKNPQQGELFNELEELVDDIEEESEDEKETITYDRQKNRGKRKPLPDSIPRHIIVIDIPDDQKEGMKCIGVEVTEKLQIEPAKIYIDRTEKKKYAPIDPEDQRGIVVATNEKKDLLPKCIAGVSLIAYIIIAKFADALPLYRQEKIFLRINAELSRQTMARWLIKVYVQLIPLYNLLQDKILESSYLQMDETRTKVLKEDGKKATSNSYVWVRYSPGDSPIVLYDYSPSRAGTVPTELLEGFSGVLQVDGYDGYSHACTHYRLIRAGCWDHCRRKFFAAAKSSGGKSIGKRAIKLIDKLYKIESKLEGKSMEEKREIRDTDSRAILEEIKAMIDELRPKVTPNSLAGKAINYGFNEWKYLSVFVDHPEINISNAMIENSIRPFALGRKNWLFSDSVNGAKASAMYYSLIETAKANGLEPFDYFKKMLEKLPNAETVEDFEALLPLKGYFKV